jgi:CBS-domain-containing membrane protein
MIHKTTKKLIAAIIAASSLVSAEPTNDHGQYHHHLLSDKATKSYKTGGPVTVHVVPHSHDDVGWLKTVDEYFDGARNDIQKTNVEVELTAVMNALLRNPERTFSEVEMKFFSMWWDHQNHDM